MAGLLIGIDGANNATVTGLQTLTNKTLASSTTFPTGHIQQVVHGTHNVAGTVEQSSFSGAISGLVAPSITTGADGNKVIVTVSLPVYIGSGDKKCYATLYRGATRLDDVGLGLTMVVGSGWMDNLFFTYVDTVATAGDYVYGVDIKSHLASPVTFCYETTRFSITCMELKG